jgi:hypothetical protein
MRPAPEPSTVPNCPTIPTVPPVEIIECGTLPKCSTPRSIRERQKRIAEERTAASRQVLDKLGLAQRHQCYNAIATSVIL